MFELTVVSYTPAGISEESGLGSLVPEAVFRGVSQDGSTAGVPTTTIYKISNSAWESIRPRLRDMAQHRIPAFDAVGVRIAGRTMPAITYDAVPLPGRHPRLTQIEHTTPLATGVNGVTTLRGTNLLGGERAVLEIYSQAVTENPGYVGTGPKYNRGQKILRITAVAPGPVGNLIGVRILPPSGGGSIVATLGADGAVSIDVTPAVPLAPAVFQTATNVADQINASGISNIWITATALVGAARVPPTISAQTVAQPTSPQYTRPLYQLLHAGDGGGLAVLDVPVVAGAPANRLRLTAQRGGNQGNRIALILRMGQGANSVTVAGTVITVNRVGATETLANLVTAIDTTPASSALVDASAVGAGSLGALTQTFLYGGAGETPTATVGGAASPITGHTDTAMVLATAAADYVAAGGAAGEEALIQVVMGEYKLSGQINVAA